MPAYGLQCSPAPVQDITAKPLTSMCPAVYSGLALEVKVTVNPASYLQLAGTVFPLFNPWPEKTRCFPEFWGNWREEEVFGYKIKYMCVVSHKLVGLPALLLLKPHVVPGSNHKVLRPDFHLSFSKDRTDDGWMQGKMDPRCKERKGKL